MTASWVGATHSIKLLYLRHPLAGFGFHTDQLFPGVSRPGLDDVLSPQTVHPLGGHRHAHSNASTTAIHHYLLVGQPDFRRRPWRAVNQAKAT